MKPIVSIVMPCFNAVSHLPMSVNSVQAQTFKDWELIVVDDGSSDDSLAWLSSQDDSRIRVLPQKNKGVSSARNKGLRAVRGEYVAFLDADDTWAPTFIDTLYTKIRDNRNAVLAYCGWKNIGLSGGRGLPFIPPDYERASKREDLFSQCRWPIHAALTRYDAVMSAGCFDERLNNAEDYLLWLEIAGTLPIVRVKEVLAYYHFHGDTQATSNYVFAALQLIKAKRLYLERHPVFSHDLGFFRRRELVYNNLLLCGRDLYWHKDLTSARIVFRNLIKSGYGHLSDWKYMLPSLLPYSVHKFLIEYKRKRCYK